MPIDPLTLTELARYFDSETKVRSFLDHIGFPDHLQPRMTAGDNLEDHWRTLCGEIEAGRVQGLNLDALIARAAEKHPHNTIFASGRQRGESDPRRRRIFGSLTTKVVPHFRGRDRELKALQELLADPGKRLIVVHGRPGIGKTELVIRLLKELQDAKFCLRPGSEPVREQARSQGGASWEVDAVVSVSLHEPASRSPNEIVARIGRTLAQGAARELHSLWEKYSAEHRLEYLFQDALQGRRDVIVLDAFEHVLGENGDILPEFAELGEFIRACLDYGDETRLLILSRKPWRMSPGLAGRHGRELAELPLSRGLSEPDSIWVLRALDNNQVLKGLPDSLLLDAARRCEGIPLALERLVQTVQRPGPGSVRANGAPDQVLGDPAFLRSIIDEPVKMLYESLSPGERQVLQALAVFNRPVPAEAVGLLLPELPVGALLRGLESSQIVRSEPDGYSLRPIDQEYAYRQIAGEALPGLHLKAADYYHTRHKPAEEWKTIDDFVPELEEFEHRLKGGEYNISHEILYDIENTHLMPWGHSGLVVELRTRLVGKLQDPEAEGVNWRCLGLAYYELGKLRDAVRCHTHSLDIAHELENPRMKCAALNNLGIAANDMGDPKTALEHFDQALPLANAIGRRDWLGNVEGNRGDAHRQLGEVGQAIVCYKAALGIHREEKYDRGEVIWLGNLMVAHHDLGELQTALAYHRQALEVQRRTNNRQREGADLANLGFVHLDLGDTPRAVECFRAGVEIATETGQLTTRGLALCGLGHVRQAEGDLDGALKHYEEARELAAETGDYWTEARLLLGLGTVHHLRNDLDKARQCYQGVLNYEVPRTKYLAVVKLGLVALEKSEQEEAARHFRQAVRLCDAILVKTPQLVDALYQLGLARLGCGNPKKAIDTYHQALKVCAAPGVVGTALQDLALLERSVKTAKVYEVTALLKQSLIVIHHS